MPLLRSKIGSTETPITYPKPEVIKPRIPTYLSLPDAAKKFGLPKKVLTQMIQAGKLEAVRLSSGELLVAAQNNGRNEPQTKAEILYLWVLGSIDIIG
jgi:hypothetical protein